MTSSNNPRFRLLVGWCCLMTSALLLVTVYLATSWQKKDDMKKNEDSNSTETNTKTAQLIGSPFGPSFNDYICFIRDLEKTWIFSDKRRSSFLSLNNGTVEITTGGLYYIHAQVTFQKSSHQIKTNANVFLLKNSGPATKARKLSEVTGYEPGSLTMIRMVKLTKGDSISLKIEPGSLVLSSIDYHTYWEILLYNKEEV
ncbi:lymphotoxin-alpha [Ctenopharyngodon idella]|uniref:lymphotoxin-alpha n=1 Tax=Ctenopharyngodon idella TaxID=7959 RepID=UPI0022319B2E|nr:lymphotoxin-alpha [Ctenopharyngodon idella]XP_051718316.1 lymphotoxin-alpha [Ctenopharyngodon idella]XP_051718317.1 lymphotoxin-alpha [Ctenopharyngodon idella]